MANISKEYSAIADLLVPRVTTKMGQEAVMVLLGHARDAHDARDLLSMLGFSRDVLMTTKAARDGVRI